ncbi:MerR family transcriptional regulator [Stappia sp. F7233]|uniref:MerR family transcriptional regulator n=1 Tax=Stappia albiluteola TaxID=2758565 RepID=A0A839A9R1_9HYPH|nr:MerR family transcriptional regulator [Stappia albiluteola]MBA5775509.1 MerR family transcriptional regulator [Stappia albiluteola]
MARAAEKVSVDVETIRFCERDGLTAQPPRVRDGGCRHYDRKTIVRQPG